MKPKRKAPPFVPILPVTVMETINKTMLTPETIPALLDFKARLRGIPPETAPILPVPQRPRKAPKPFLEMYREFQRQREIARFIEAVEKLAEEGGKS